MENEKKEKTFSATAGFGSRSDRHGEGVDPALPGSSSYQGPTASLPAGLAENVASADDTLTRRLRSCTSRSSLVQGLEEEDRMDTDYTSAVDLEENASDDDAKSCISLMSSVSTATASSVDRKRKLDDEYRTSASKRRQEGGTSSETKGFKEPVRQSSAIKGKALSQVPSKTHKSEEELYGMTITDLRNTALEWINHIEIARMSSGNLQGRLNGIIKDRLVSLGDVIRCLAEKAEDKGDPIFHKMQSKELNAKIKCLEKEEVKWKVERNRYEEEMMALTKKNEEIEAKLWEISRKSSIGTASKIGKVKTAEELDREWPALRPPIQGVRKVLTTYMPSQAPPIAGPTQEAKKIEDTEIGNITKEIKKLLTRKKQLIKDRVREGTDKEEETETDGEERATKRTLPKVISNIQVRPPKSHIMKSKDTDEEGRSTASKRTRKKKEEMPAQKGKSNVSRKERNILNDRKAIKPKKVPKTAAVTITAKEGVSYAEILRHAREKISLSSIGIDTPRIRKGINGGIIIEISGEENSAKAANLVNKLKEILPDTDKIRVAQPTTMVDLKITGLDDSVSKQEVSEAVARLAKCDTCNIKTGDIRWMTNGLGVIWVRCPASTANLAAATGKIAIGWTVARIEILPPRPLQCYRCWNFGHARYSCTSKVDRSNHCYKCGDSTHKVIDCKAPKPHCIICEESGMKATHRLGSASCNALVNSSNRNRNKPLPRIRREELEIRNKKNTHAREEKEDGNIYTKEEDRQGSIYKRKDVEKGNIYNSDGPDRRTSDMDIEDDAVP